jgi:hypothetical protein
MAKYFTLSLNTIRPSGLTVRTGNGATATETGVILAVKGNPATGIRVCNDNYNSISGDSYFSRLFWGVIRPFFWRLSLDGFCFCSWIGDYWVRGSTLVRNSRDIVRERQVKFRA